MRYGAIFERMTERWAVIENEHDKIHPDRNDCGGVGGCTMMRAARDLMNDMESELIIWRRSLDQIT